MAEAAAVIQEAHRSGVPNRLVNDLERRLGLSYGAGQGILFRPAAIVAKIPDTLFWDSMHTVYASGGVAQYECNQYAQEIIGIDISRGQLAEFKNKFTFSPGRGHLRSFVLQERIVRGNESHLRGFASEVLMLVKMFNAFGKMVLGPVGLLPRHSHCIALLDRLGDFFKSGRMTTHEALTLNLPHQQLYMDLYPGCAKPKIHYLWHCILDRFQHGVSLDCFAPERKHRFSKRLGAFCYRNMTRTFLAKASAAVLSGFEQDDVFQQFSLRPPVRKLAICPGFPNLGNCQSARAMRGPFGAIESKQFVLWREGASSITTSASTFGGEVVKCLAAAGEHYVLVSLFAKDDANTWRKAQGQTGCGGGELARGASLHR